VNDHQGISVDFYDSNAQRCQVCLPNINAAADKRLSSRSEATIVQSERYGLSWCGNAMATHVNNRILPRHSPLKKRKPSICF